jgi:cyclophilin family peptidyl-prolyl cis-trans isomerase
MRSALALALAAACARPTPSAGLRPEVEASLQRIELGRVPSAEARALLDSPEAPARVRAVLAVGRIGDGEAKGSLSRLLADKEAGEMAAWALGRIEGGSEALVRCLAERCPSSSAAARALSGTEASRKPAVEALVEALSGPASRDAAISLGVLARNPEAKFPPQAYAALATSLGREDARAGAAYALSRLPRGPGVEAALRTGLLESDPWTRSLAARAWGRQGLPAVALRDAFRDPDWRVRVEAARGLPTAEGAKEALAEAFAGQGSPHVIVALSEAAAQLEELAPEPARFADSVSRCAVALARDRVRKQIVDTPSCAADGWRVRARVGALAAELGLPQAREAFSDGDGRVRGSAAGAATAVFAGDLRRLLADADPFVVQEAAGTLARLPADPATREAALAAIRRLSAAHTEPGGNPRSDALAALTPLAGPVPDLLPTPNAALARALGSPRSAVPVPAEARAFPGARLLRLKTSRGELVIELRPDVAPLTGSALAALARRGFYGGLTFHRVVPDFVAQGGDPRGDGDGGPEWALPDEHGPLHFLRGTLGIATNGAETGGSQFFLCHSPQPHLDGRYTVAGQLRSGEDVLDALQPGDTIESASAE